MGSVVTRKNGKRVAVRRGHFLADLVNRRLYWVPGGGRYSTKLRRIL